MIDAQSFLKELEKNEDDTPLRLVYADWLEDHGEAEEAERQRMWPAAKQWLVKFYADAWEKEVGKIKADNPEWEPDPDDWPGYLDSYERMMEAAKEAADEGFDSMGCGNSEWLCYALRENHDAFWKNFCIVSGCRLPDDMKEKGWFSCGC